MSKKVLYGWNQDVGIFSLFDALRPVDPFLNLHAETNVVGGVHLGHIQNILFSYEKTQ